jgi:hypothetical protein
MNGQFERILKENPRSLVEVLLRNLPGMIVENGRNLSQDSWYPGQDSKRVPPERKSRALPKLHATRLKRQNF